ncbi:DUF6694 family lipoprotein [Pseudomonas sp. XWY-1]|uniref:DUF6694 family lipoprotein n=1 Tax=Pseudomonas sp. XWY-1 TaxID=2069256 RepID=UPI00131A3191|nr:DUF6694 family lipoprotein [Pseudomonas sp. XWY-1]
MNKAKLIAAAGLAISMALLAGCGDKKIDGSSDANFQKSAKAIYDSLPDEKKASFGMALAQGQALGIHEKGQSFAQALDGKTADEAIAFIKAGVKEKTTFKW